MIKYLKIKNFKSIKNIEFECKKINVFIGKPNTGKSNILESIGIFGLPYVEGNIKKLLRLETMSNLFYDNEISEDIEIFTDSHSFILKYSDGLFVFQAGKGEELYFRVIMDYNNNIIQSIEGKKFPPFRFYRFIQRNNFPSFQFTFLFPPDAPNLLHILLINKEIKKTVANILAEFGFKIVLKPQEAQIEIQKEIEDVIVSYPYSLLSDTLQRIIFHLVAVETNKGSIIIFEEPEAHAFPYYTKFLAERIALDTTNQYFISTHNPYFLLPLIEKTNKDNICIFITHFENYQTKIKLIKEDELEKIIDFDTSIFFNLDEFLEK